MLKRLWRRMCGYWHFDEEQSKVVMEGGELKWPSFVLKFNGVMTEQQTDELRESWNHGGFDTMDGEE